jgi:hypothetical protein
MQTLGAQIRASSVKQCLSRMAYLSFNFNCTDYITEIFRKLFILKVEKIFPCLFKGSESRIDAGNDKIAGAEFARVVTWLPQCDHLFCCSKGCINCVYKTEIFTNVHESVTIDVL